MKPTKKNQCLSLYPLKAEEALALFMRVDPVKIEGFKILQKNGKAVALPRR
jgi:hypothetical protein